MQALAILVVVAMLATAVFVVYLMGHDLRNFDNTGTHWH